MNVLDNHINDLDYRIQEICKAVPTVAESSVQESLSSYGWILLDSWIAWRTLRFLIKDINITEDIQKKWFQTPSSYTASQLRAVWDFGENVDNYLDKKCSHKLKFLLDEEIQKNRNLSAHFSCGGLINGSDYIKIDAYHKYFKNLFLLSEIVAFLNSLVTDVFNNAEARVCITDAHGNNLVNNLQLNFRDVDLMCVDIDNISKIELLFKNVSDNLKFTSSGCEFFYKNVNYKLQIDIFGNKGFYRDKSVFKKIINM